VSAQVRVQGLPKLRRELKAFQGDVEDLKAANAAVSSLVASAASARAPRRSGALAASVRGNRAAGRASVMAGGARTPYAGPIHYGWPARGIEGNAFVVDAAQATEGTWLPKYVQDVQKAADKVRGDG
jgi:hypothetical protein